MIDTDIERLKELASDLLPLDLIAILLDVDEIDLREAVDNRQSPASIAYYTGKAETIAEIRRQEVKLAKAGSPFAIEQIADYIIEQTTSENG